jgi:hypothetical protein
MQGKSIPKYLGHFTLQFHERELDDDRIVNLLMMEVVDGTLLHKLPAKRLLPAERKLIADSTLKLAQDVHEAGIFFSDLYLNKFIYLKGDSKVRLVGFSNTYDPAPTGVTGQEQVDQIGRMIIRLRSRFEEKGFV